MGIDFRLDMLRIYLLQPKSAGGSVNSIVAGTELIGQPKSLFSLI